MGFDKLSKFLEIRADRWKWLAARDVYLAVIFEKVVKDNDLSDMLWQVSPFDPDNGSTDSAVCIRWKKEYHLVAGDIAYNIKDEKIAAITYCSISVMVHGSTPGDFIGKAYFIVSNEDGHMRADVKIPQREFSKSSAKAPIWFGAILADVYKHNSRFLKRT